MGMASLRELLVGAACLIQVAAGLNGGFRASLSLRDFKEQVSMCLPQPITASH